MRFVAGVVDGTTVFVNAPFATPPVGGEQMGATVTYPLVVFGRSASIYDAWDPTGTAVQRILNGAAMDVMKVKVNGDFHEFTFSGGAGLDRQCEFRERAGGAYCVSGGAEFRGV